ncbi:MAG: glycosyltransferase family A protein [Polyangiaceae bacterium]
MPPLVSCLCVTERRAAFMPWLLWGFERQTYEHRELVIVDSSPEPLSISRANVRVLAAPPGSNVPTKRNLALDAARGDYIAWFDDDDWQHPERLERLVESLREDHVIVGSSRSWFVDSGDPWHASLRRTWLPHLQHGPVSHGRGPQCALRRTLPPRQ